MTRELIEAAKAVLEAAYYNVPHDVSTDQGAKRYAAFQRLYAAVRAAEAAPVADAERVLEAAKAAVIAIPGFKNISALSQWAVGLVADAIRPYITPAPVADTVAVPVATLREIRRSAVSTHTLEGYPESSCTIAKIIDALLPPREPPRELVAEWEREAHRADPIGSHKNTTMRERECFEAGFVSACRARWAADPKNGGA